jgi:hypothetical protein
MSVKISEPSGTLSEIKRAGAYSNLQPIAAEYYNLTDVVGNPIASLLVLMDRKMRPVRAEVHLYDTNPAEQDIALRQARLLLEDRYYSPEPMPVYVLRSRMERERINVKLKGSPPATGSRIRLRYLIGALALVVILAYAAWQITGALRNNDNSSQASASEQTAIIANNNQAGVVTGAQETSTGPVASATQPISIEGLEPSRNADPRIQIGQVVRIRPGFSLTLRSEPGATAGEEVGYLGDEGTGTVISGPVQLPGETDTIVWWRLRLSDGTEGWAPANTSKFTLLEPVE